MRRLVVLLLSGCWSSSDPIDVPEVGEDASPADTRIIVDCGPDPFDSAPADTLGQVIPDPTATPVFDPPSGTTACKPFDVRITSVTPGAVIRYTTDGTNPTTASTPYAGPIAIVKTTTLKAMALAPGFSPSAIATTQYTLAVLAAVPPRPKLSPAGGTHADPVSPSCVDDDCKVGIKYSGPVIVTPTATGTTVRARTCAACFSPGFSEVVTETYRTP